MRKEYLRRTRKFLETKFCSRNFIKEINTYPPPLVGYSGPFLKRTRNEVRQIVNQQEKENLLSSRICYPHRKQSRNKRKQKMNKYLHLARELRKLKNTWLSLITIIVGALGTVPKCLERGLEELEIIWKTSRLQLKYWEESWRSEETRCHSDSCEVPPADVSVKSSQRVKL